MARAYMVAILGRDGEPARALSADLQRLDYQAALLPWPAASLAWQGPRPLATIIDLRVLTFEAARACQAVREHRVLKQAPLVALVPEQEAARLDLSLGFDDLILTPYRLTELAARLRLLVWRSEAEPAPGVVRVGRMMLDEATYEVRIDGLPVDLALKEYQLLAFLVRNPSRVFTREELLDRVWGGEYFGGTRTVDVHVRRVREKTVGAGDLIETVRGVGYRFVLPPE